MLTVPCSARATGAAPLKDASDSVQAAYSRWFGPTPPNTGPSGKSPIPASSPLPIHVCFCRSHSSVPTTPRKPYDSTTCTWPRTSTGLAGGGA